MSDTAHATDDDHADVCERVVAFIKRRDAPGDAARAREWSAMARLHHGLAMRDRGDVAGEEKIRVALSYLR